MVKVSGGSPKYAPPKGTSSSLPGCTSEGITYALECLSCRKKGTKRIYIGESSRSAYQRGMEHLKDVSEGVLDHPFVQHFWEEHGGKQQEVMMRVLSLHIKSQERQVQESVRIEKLSEIEKECLNLKSE